MRTRSIRRDFSKPPTIIPRRGNQLSDRRVYPAIPLPPGEKTTKPKQCTMMIGTFTVPTRCAARVYKAGRCLEHYADWAAAREARGIEQREYRRRQQAAGKLNAHGRVTPPTTRVEVKAKPYVRKADRKKSKKVA